MATMAPDIHFYEKEILNSDGQQFYQYQENEQPPFILAHGTQTKTMTYDVRNPGPGFGTGTTISYHSLPNNMITQFSAPRHL